jgi:hypothetical protein
MTSEMVYAVQLAAACTILKTAQASQASWAERVRMQVPNRVGEENGSDLAIFKSVSIFRGILRANFCA